MSQVLAEQNDTNNDVVNNNQPEWNKIFPTNGMILNENIGERVNVYSGEDTNEKQFTGKNTFKHVPKPGDSRFSNIEDGLDSSISADGKERIHRILNDVNHLSDVEKLLLYLKLPTGATPDDGLRQTPTSFLQSSNRIEQAQAFTWIRSHLEEDSEICVPKHEVYDDYRLYCESHNLKPLCPADFGKVMKCVFPNVKPRRLGQRGQSKYCYSGLRKKLEVQPPALPDLEITPKKEKEEKNEEDEVYTASRQLVCEWAHKLLGGNFTSLKELAEFLVGNLYVNSKSTAAFTVLAAMQDAGVHNSKVPVSSLFTCTSGGNKHKETQLQLQRKLQERELIKEQKRKLQQQRSENERENEHLQVQSANVSPPSFQSPLRSATRNITKLLQSQGVSDRLNASPQPLQQIIGSNRDRVTADESGTIISCNNLSCMDTDGVVSKASIDHRMCDGGQFHVVKKPAVRQAGHFHDVADKSIFQSESENQEHPPTSEIATTSEKTESVLFALPTTPSRSAFVPVSNQWKDLCSNIAQPATAGAVDKKETLFLNTTDANPNSVTLQGEHQSECKSASSPVTITSESVSSIPSSPQTPKKSRSRFTPIRPKVTPTKTVSSILKDHKNANGDGPAYDNRPVSAILKEKRAREAQEILVQLASNVQLQSGQLSQNVSIKGSVETVGTDILKLPMHSSSCSKSSEMYIIVGSPKPGDSRVNDQSLSTQASDLDLLGNSQFSPNVTVPIPQPSQKLTVLLSQKDESKDQCRKHLDSNSLDNSELSDSGDINDSEMTKSDVSQDMLISRDTDTPSGRKRKSSDRDIESKTKRMNSTDPRSEDDEIFSSICADFSSEEVNEDSACSKTAISVSRDNLSVESLESDALLDTAPMAVDHSLVSSISKPGPLSTQTASIGVSTKTMSSAQKQLMQQKVQLDQRISNFFNKGQRGSKENEAMSQQMKMLDEVRIEQILQQYMQQHKKLNVKSDTNFSSNKTVTSSNSRPVNLLSLLRQPVFDCTKPVWSTVGKAEPNEQNSENLTKNKSSVMNKHQPLHDDIPQKPDTVDRFRDTDSSDLPSDIADFITENMITSREQSSVPSSVSLSEHLQEIQTLSILTKVQNSMESDNTLEEVNSEGSVDRAQSTVDVSTQQFTVPSTPPRQKLDLANAKHKFIPVERSSSLPVFTPPLSTGQSHMTFISLGKGLDMPAPPNRVVESSSPQPLHQKAATPVNFTITDRQPSTRPRKTSIDRLGNNTPMSDAGYHSFDTSPVMNFTPAPMMGSSDNLPTAASTSTLILRPESAQSFTNEQLTAPSPIPISPRAVSAQSTQSSVVSPQITSQSSISTSPCENISPNSFMPIQGSMFSSCSPLGNPQLVTPIKPRVAIVTSSNSTVTSPISSSSILMHLTSKDCKEHVLSPIHQTLYHVDKKNTSKQTAVAPKESRELRNKTVLRKLLNTTSLPSYEEAVNNLGREKVVNKELTDISVSKTESLQLGSTVTTKSMNASLARSASAAEVEIKQKHESNPILKDTLAKSTTGPVSKVISTSEYPFSYQLALLREKCLNPSGKENKKIDNEQSLGQSVQKKHAVDKKPTDQKPMSSEKNVPMMDTEESNFGNQRLDARNSMPVSGQVHSKANVTPHHFGPAAQKPGTGTSQNSSVVSNAYVRSESCTAVVKPFTKPAHPRSFSLSSVPSVKPVTSLSSTNKQSTAIFPTFDLPNVNYVGNAPNIDLGSILQSKQSGGAGYCSSSDGDEGEYRPLTLMQALQPTQTINEEELQSTLEILRSLDSQYFSQPDLDLDTMQPCGQSTSQLLSKSPTAAPAEPSTPSQSSLEVQKHRTIKRSWSYKK